MNSAKNRFTINWKVKSFIYYILGKIQGDKILWLLQTHISKRMYVKTDIAVEWKRHLNAYNQFKSANASAIFEFGAGKSLVQNIYLSKFISEQIVVDLSRMLDIRAVNLALSAHRPDLKVQVQTADELMQMGILYHAPLDASKLPIPSGTVSMVLSTNTLEHIPISSIKEILNETYRILAKGGGVSFQIDYSDHYAHTDPNIPLNNFLKYSDASWEKYNHRMHYQNRLRHYQYLKLIEEAGFKIVKEEFETSDGISPIALDKIFDPHEASVYAISGYICAKKDG